MNDEQPKIDGHLAAGERVLLMSEVDIDREGRFGRRWLAVTDRRLMTFASDGAPGASGAADPARSWPST